jgi:tellurite resistance protein TehA-like permease
MTLPRVPAGSFAAVMATGIVSVGAALVGRPYLSTALLVVAGIAFAGLAILVAGTRPAVRHADALTFVAGAAVLGARLTGSGRIRLAFALWIVAACAWIALLAARPELPRRGSRLLAVVATESLAVVGTGVAVRWSWHALALVAFALWAAGLLLYVVLIAPVGVRLARGRFSPDDWISMGALAISTVAATELVHVDGALRDAALGVWAAGTAWIPVLVAADLRCALRPRRGLARWSTVFPLGMYAVASDTLGRAAGFAPLRAVGGAFLAVALLAWAATCTGLAVNTARRAADHSR